MASSSPDEEERRIARPPISLMVLAASLLVASVRLVVAASAAQGPPAAAQTRAVVVSRLAALSMVVHRAWVVVARSPPVVIQLAYGPGSAFTPRPVELSGPGRLCTFTVQSWFLEGLYFALALSAGSSSLVFGVVFATAHLVSALTSYVLIPIAARDCARRGANVLEESPFFTTNGLVMHNANVVLCHVDMFLSRTRIHAAHVGGAIIWACWYIVFAWILASRRKWLPYPFIDYTLPLPTALLLHLGLAALLAAFHLLGVAFSSQLLAWPLPLRLTAHLAVLALVCRTRPPRPPAEAKAL